MSLDTLPAPEAGTDITGVLQARIDEVASKGGGQVTLPLGRWTAGAIVLKSGIDLHLPRGATLVASDNYEDFRAGEVSVVAEDSDRGFITARGASDISISGQGVIDGGGQAWCAREGLFDGVRWAKFHRPRMVVFEGCRNIRITDVTFLEAPMWTVHLVGCEAIRIRDVVIRNDMLMPNTDGINFDGCREAVMSGCRIVAADDSVCIKTCKGPGHGLSAKAERIIVTDSHFTSRSCAIKIGTETHSDIRDVIFSRITVTDSNRAIGIFARDGGVIERIRISDITVDCSQSPHTYWGSGEPITITSHARDPGRPPSVVRDIAVSGVTGRCEGAIVVHGDPMQPIENVQISDINLRQDPGAFAHELYLDLRPVPEDVNDLDDPEQGRRNCFKRRPDGGIYGMDPYPHGLPAVFIRHARHVQTEAVQVMRPDPLPHGWAEHPVDTD